MAPITPGDWSVEKDNFGWKVQAMPPLGRVTPYFVARTHTETNARAIALMPKMIEVVRASAGTCPHCIGNPMVTTHTAECKMVTEILARLDGKVQDGS